MGEQIVYPKTGVCGPSTFSNNFYEITRQIELNLHLGNLYDGGTKVCSNGPGHLTRIAVKPIYGKNPLKIFSRTRRPMSFGLDM